MSSPAPFSTETYLQRMLDQLQRIEDLWQKLVYVKWSPQYFPLLNRLSQELERAATGFGNQRLLDLASRLRHHIATHLGGEHIPRRVDQELLATLLAELRQGLSSDAEARSELSSLLIANSKIVVITPDHDSRLVFELKEAGFQVNHLTNLEEAEKVLLEGNPTAVIVDADFDKNPLAGIQMINQVRARLTLSAPVYFISERGDLTARLQAVRAGGNGFFLKPVNFSSLLEQLKNWLLEKSARHRDRVLIIHENFDQAKKITTLLEFHGIVTHIETQPLQTMQELYRFQPDLVLMDLDMKTVNGSELAIALGQHRSYPIMPLILLSEQAKSRDFLSRLAVRGAYLLTKPLNDELLGWIVRQSLHWARDLSLMISDLSNKDQVTGLFNRYHFMDQLKFSMTALGVSTSSVAVTMVVLNNLRSIRDSTNMVVTDEVLAQAAKRLTKVLGSRHQAARFGESVFALMHTDTHRDMLLNMARELRNVLETDPYTVGEQTLPLFVHIGIVITNDNEADYLDLIHRADTACSMAGETSQERIYIQHQIHGKRDDEEIERQQSLDIFGEVIEQHRVKLVFQPIVSLRQGDNTERYEVLSRIQNKEGEDLFVDSIFRVAQWHPIGARFDRLIVADAIRALTDRQARGFSPLLFVKLLPVSLRDKEFLSWLEQTIKDSPFDPNQLVLELPETAAKREFRMLQEFSKAVKGLGFGFSLDQFGRSVEEAPSLLNRLSLDYVKLNVNLTRGLTTNKAKQKQVKKLIDRLRACNVAVIVSGVEDIHVLPLLWSYNVDFIQGFFLQRPYEEMVYDFTEFSR